MQGCVPSATRLCENFDAVGASYDKQGSNARLSVSTTDFTSAPRALRVFVDPIDANLYGTAFIERPMSVVSPKMVQARLRLKVVKNAGFTNVLQIGFRGDTIPDRTSVVALQVGPTSVKIIEQTIEGGSELNFDAHHLKLMTWPTAWMDVTVTWRDDRSVVLSIDGVTSAPAPLFSEFTRGTLAIQYGVTFSNGGGDCDALLDDIQVDATF